MRTTRFQPKEKLHLFIRTFKARIDRAGMTAKIYESSGNVKIDSIRLKKAEYHTGGYDERYGGNWFIEHEKGKPIARNVHFPNIKAKIRRTKHLNYDDWVRFNTIFNKTADDLGIIVNLKSAWGWIRRGREWGSW